MKAQLADDAKMVGVAASLTDEPGSPPAVEAHLLGRFVITAGGRSTGTWPRPTARRLCQLVLTSPGRRLSRDAACEALFPTLSPEAAVGALYKALSLARSVLGELGPTSAGLLCADRGQIWAAPNLDLEVDLDVHEQALRNALKDPPGPGRDVAIAEALSTGGTPLADEVEAEWAVRVRERVEYLRREARFELARDRARGIGCARPEQVLEAWQACFEADPSDEEAASALMRLHTAQNRRPLAVAVYERCRSSLATLGLQTSPALEELRASVEGARPSARIASPAPSDLAPRHVEERRLVSVAFVELSPAGLGAGADPEDVRELVGAGLAQAISEVELFGGTVVSVSGSGMSVLFGAPQSHEDDPERALRSALRIASAAARPAAGNGSGTPSAWGSPFGRSGVALSVRVGVETGLAVVGPVGGDKMGYGAVGEVVGTAAALQSVARAGSVLVGPSTRAATEDIFEWGPGQDVALSPGAKPTPASYLVQPLARPAAEASRRRLAAKAPLVGRQAEVAQLAEMVRATVSGRGGAVVLIGEAGLGKSRLVAECRNYFMAWVGAASGRLPLWLEGRCASYASSTPYGAYQQLLSRFIGAPLEGGEALVRPALEAATRAVLGKDKQPLPVLARLLGLPAGPGEAHLGRMSPAELQHATFSALRTVLEKLVSKGPTVLALEDLHWSDPTSLRLTADLGELAATGPLLLLATRRPEPDPGLGELETTLAAFGPLLALHLGPIARPDERALARSLLGGQAGDEVVDVACQGVEGNPLYLEERLASLLESGALERDSTGWQSRKNSAGAVPEAIERLIRSRADRLGPAAREALVAASVLGEEVERSGLKAVSELGDELDDALSELVSGGLLTEARARPEPLYRFRHALIQEATYNGLLRSQRRQLHARAAWDLEARSSTRLDEVAAVLGRHFAAAGETDRAVHYLELAADHAARILANEEAIALCRQALAVIDGGAGPSSPGQPAVADGRTATALDLREKLALLLTVVDRFGEARTTALDGLARVNPGDALRAARLQYALANIELQDNNFDAALAACDTIDQLIGPCWVNDDRERVDLWVHMQTNVQFSVHFWRNELERAAEVIESVRPLVEAVCGREVVACFSLALAQQHVRERRYRVDAQILEEHRWSVAVTQALGPATTTEPNESQRCCALSNLGIALTWHGDLAEAQEVHEQAMASAVRLGSPGARGRVLVDLAVNALRRGDVEVVRELASHAREAASSAGVLHYAAAATALQAWVAWRDQQVGETLALGAQALELWQAGPLSWPFQCLALWPLAGAHLDAGHIAEAVGTARRLLEPSQLRLPDELEGAVQVACDTWDNSDPESASRLLADAVKLARELGYA